MILHRLLQIVTGVLLGLAVLALVFFLAPGEGGDPFSASDAALEPGPYPAPGLALRDPENRTVALDDYRGEVILVFFGFANCPDVCPLTLARWTRALETMEREGKSFQGLFVSVDPARDTPAALERWMSAFHPSFRALTGSRDEIAATAAAWNVHVRVQSEPVEDPHAAHREGIWRAPAPAPSLTDPPAVGEEGYLVEHSSRTFVVDGEGRVVRTFPAYLDAEEIVALLEAVVAP